ncbi:MAG: site-specific integrase [Bacteroidales bacterium]|nr:site-specific integrase [Bacteroidales bacterium]
MINFSLYAKDAKQKGHITIYLRINKASEKIRISTRITVPGRNWNQDAQMVIKGGDFDLAFYREKLSKTVAAVEEIVRRANLENWDLVQVQLEVGRIFGKTTATAKKGVLSLYQEWATVGTATKTTPRACDKLTYNVFKEFVKEKDVPFISITYQFYSDFVLWLRTHKKYKENSVGNHIRNLKAVMNEGFKRKLHNNVDFKEFVRPQEEVVNINLTSQELEKIYKCKVTGIAEKVRDVFVLGCYVAQRHSDYSRISMDDVKDGYIHILQKKTGHRIRIPLHPVAKAILDKYNGVVPKISIQKFNEHIKEIAKFAKIKDKVHIVEMKAGKKVDRYCEKWELVTSHTARKTGVTNALRAGVPIEDCMYLAGIKSPAVFRKYAGVTSDEYSERLANSKYFSGDEETERLVAFAAKVIRSGKTPYWLERMKMAYSANLKK